MRRTIFIYLLATVTGIIILSCDPDSRRDDQVWPEITRESKPWTRWWWLGSDVDRENLTSLFAEYGQAGFGGVEITPIYGVKGREDRYIEFLSPAWMEMLKTSVSEAGKHGMGVDMNLGTGWPFGGPQITPEYAASRLILKKYELHANESLREVIIPDDPRQVELGARLEVLVAWSENNEYLDLTDSVGEDMTLNWIPGQGNWELYAAFCGKTRQRVKRAAPGGEGYTMDHLSASALETYLGRFDEAFPSSIGVRSFFNDSYEVYNASWSPGFFDAFSERRGYDLKKYLKLLAGEGDTNQVARVKSDYRQTMSEMLLENFTVPWTEWAHKHQGLTRNQAHGSPGNLIDLYAAVDIPECEIFGHRTFDIPGLPVNDDDSRNVEPNPMMLKLATSAAHITGKPLISNETFTWLGEHFKVALSQCKPEVEEAFLAGINHVFYHGTTYSPADAAWPGWLFYASVNFAPGNSFWPHLPGLNQYITRCQSILQSGKSDNEVLVYWPIYDIWHNPEGLDMQITVHNIKEWLVYPGIEKMAQAGHSFDFISDALLQQVASLDGKLVTAKGKTTYDVLVIPDCEFMSLETLQKVIDLANTGCTVIFEDLPGDVPGLHDLEIRREQFMKMFEGLHLDNAGNGIRSFKTGNGTIILSDNIHNALTSAGFPGERITATGLKFTRRALRDGKYYYLVNHTPQTIDRMVPLNTKALSVLALDPQSGKYGKVQTEPDGDRIAVRVQLKPGESLFLRTFNNRKYEGNAWAYHEKEGEPVEIQGTWKLEFVSGGPELPGPQEMGKPVPWTDLSDPSALTFSGTATYSVNFRQDDLSADGYVLDLGKVHHSARIWLNGHDLGILWSVPFRIDIGKYMQEGENRLSIEVANLMANRIIYMDRQGITWRNFHEINFVNIQYQPFDASGWDIMASGLSGPVSIIPVFTTGGKASEDN
jgi:hypothetical protein